MFMFMCKCLSVISSSSRYRRGTVPTRDSRHVSTRFSVSTSSIHPSSSPSTLRGDRRAHRVPDLPREDKKSTCTLRLSQHSSSPCSPRTKASLCVRPFLSPPSRFPHEDAHSEYLANTNPTRGPRWCSCAALSLSTCARFFSPAKRNIVLVSSSGSPVSSRRGAQHSAK